MSTVHPHIPHSVHQNRLLDTLPTDELARLHPHLKLVPMQHLLLRHTQALLAQTAQTAQVCNRHHFGGTAALPSAAAMS